MAVISVEVDNEVARKFNPYNVVSTYEFMEKIQAKEESDLVDFWAEWVSAGEVLAHLETLK